MNDTRSKGLSPAFGSPATGCEKSSRDADSVLAGRLGAVVLRTELQGAERRFNLQAQGVALQFSRRLAEGQFRFDYASDS